MLCLLNTASTRAKRFDRLQYRLSEPGRYGQLPQATLGGFLCQADVGKAAKGEGALIAGAEGSGADQDDRLVFCAVGQTGEFMADKQAGQVIGLLVRGEFAGEPQGAGTEQGGQHAALAVLRARHLHAAWVRRVRCRCAEEVCDRPA